MDIVMNGRNSERYPTISKGLVCYYPLDGTYQCCLEILEEAICLCLSFGDINNMVSKLSNDYKIKSVLLPDFSPISTPDEFISSFENGEELDNVIINQHPSNMIIDATSFNNISQNEMIDAVCYICEKYKIPTIVINNNIELEIICMGGVSVLYALEMPKQAKLLKHISKGSSAKGEALGCMFDNDDEVKVKNKLVIPYMESLENGAIHLFFKIEEGMYGKIASLKNAQMDGEVVGVSFNNLANKIIVDYSDEESTKTFDAINLNKGYNSLTFVIGSDSVIKTYINAVLVASTQIDITENPELKVYNLVLGRDGDLGAIVSFRNVWIYDNSISKLDDNLIKILSKSIFTME